MRKLALALLLACAAPTAHAADDWQVTRSPFDPRIIARYKQLLRKNPDDGFALGKLLQLYRRHKSLDALAAEYKGASGAERIVLGHIHRERGVWSEAEAAYRAALDAGDGRARLHLAGALERQGKAEAARALYEAALAEAKDARAKRPILRKLVAIATLPGQAGSKKAQLERARGWFEQLLALDPNDDDTRRELAELYAQAGQPERGGAEWLRIAERLSADPARQAEALRRAGELFEEAKDDPRALEAYERALKLAPREHYLRREALERIAGVYRRKDELRHLLGTWERAWPDKTRGFVEWELLARLCDELGDAPRAREYFKRALALDPRALEARKRLIALYEREAKTEEVVAEYRRLVQAAPGEPRFRLELAQRLMRTPDGAKEAIAICRRLGQQTRDPSVHAQLAELYQRWGLADEALKEREQLVRLEPSEETHLVDLGELHFQRGKKERALEIWRRILSLPGKKELQMARLAEVYAEHDLPGEALELYQKAVKLQPQDPTLKKGLAAALERMHRDQEALAVWEELFELQLLDPKRTGRLETRQRLLGLLLRLGRLPSRLQQYKARAGEAKTDDARAAWGLLAADGALKLGRLDEAERVLLQLEERVADRELKADAWVGLAQVHRARRRPKEVVAALKRAAELSPGRARELYAQIAELSLQLYRDADALAYAKKAIELGPQDASAQLRLAEVLEKREQIDEAVAAYERAIELNDRLWKPRFQLSRLELRRGAHAQAARQYREILRKAPEEELVVDAARRAIDLEEYLGTLGELERELSPLAYAHPDKRVYRNLLLELYERHAWPLVERARQGDAQARKELERLGQSGLRPLLDVLVDGDPNQERLAVTLLGEMGNPGAAEPLLKLASARPGARRPLGELRGTLGLLGAQRGRPEVLDLRIEAALSGARLATPKEGPLLAKLLGDEEKLVRLAAAFGLGRVSSPQSEPALLKALSDGSGDVQAAACVGLGRHRAAQAVPELARLLRDGRSEPARAGCAVALGLLGAQAEPARRDLEALLAEGGELPQRAAAWALGRLGARRSAGPLLTAVFTGREEVRQAAAAALEPAPPATRATLATSPERTVDGLDVRGWLEAAIDPCGPSGCPDPARVSTVGLEEAAHAALAAALGRHRDVVLRALADLDARAGDLAPRLQPLVEKLAGHADAQVRARAATVLGYVPAALPRLLESTTDTAVEVRLAALEALGRHRDPEAVRALRRALRSEDWRERRAACVGLGRAGETEAVRAALDDPSGFVREAAGKAASGRLK